MISWSQGSAERNWGELFFYFGLANFGNCRLISQQDLMANLFLRFFCPCFSSASAPSPPNNSPKMHAQTCRQSSPISLSRTPNFIHADFLLTEGDQDFEKEIRGATALRGSGATSRIDVSPAVLRGKILEMLWRLQMLWIIGFGAFPAVLSSGTSGKVWERFWGLSRTRRKIKLEKR